MIAANRITGSLVYRTREALRGNTAFLEKLKGYEYYPSCFSPEGRFNLWHYPGTHGEISSYFLRIPDSRLKFPALLSFNPVKETVKARQVTYIFNLAFVAPVHPEWCTETREAEVFDRLLVPVYTEYMHQVKMSGYFDTTYGDVPHTRFKIFTTGKAKDGIVDSYGDHIDALEIHALELKAKACYPAETVIRMNEENNSVIVI
jgi:hypothetical protein